MVDPHKKLQRQIDRKNSRERYEQLREDQLRDIAYHGLTQEQIRLDAQQKNLTEWLNKP